MLPKLVIIENPFSVFTFLHCIGTQSQTVFIESTVQMLQLLLPWNCTGSHSKVQNLQLEPKGVTTIISKETLMAF